MVQLSNYLGQTVNIRMKENPDTFTGTIVSIGNLATSTPNRQVLNTAIVQLRGKDGTHGKTRTIKGSDVADIQPLA